MNIIFCIFAIAVAICVLIGLILTTIGAMRQREKLIDVGIYITLIMTFIFTGGFILYIVLKLICF